MFFIFLFLLIFLRIQTDFCSLFSFCNGRKKERILKCKNCWFLVLFLWAEKELSWVPVETEKMGSSSVISPEDVLESIGSLRSKIINQLKANVILSLYTLVCIQYICTHLYVWYWIGASSGFWGVLGSVLACVIEPNELVFLFVLLVYS